MCKLLGDGVTRLSPGCERPGSSPLRRPPPPAPPPAPRGRGDAADSAARRSSIFLAEADLDSLRLARAGARRSLSRRSPLPRKALRQKPSVTRPNL